jgi:PAS domain S-box-containing protein
MSNLREHLRRMGVAYIILLVSLAPAAFVFQRVRFNVQAREEARLNNAVRDLTDHVESHFTDATHVLWGIRGLFLASHKVRPTEWNLFLDSVEFSEETTGFRDLGFALRVPATNLTAHIEEQRREMRPGYKIGGPASARSEYFPIIFLRDKEAGDVRALGWDPYANPERRAAMEAARDTAEPVATVPVPMALPNGDFSMHGHIVYFPVYRGVVQPPTVEERREKLIGFVFASFVEDRIWQAIFPPEKDPLFDLDVFYGANSRQGRLVFDRDPALTRQKAAAANALVTEKPLRYFSQQWVLRTTTLPKFGAGNERFLPVITLAAAGALSITLFLLAALQARSRAALQREKERLAVTLRSIADGVIATDTAGKIVLFNNAAAAITGWPIADAMGRSIQEILSILDEKSGEQLTSSVEQILEDETATETHRTVVLMARDGAERVIAKSAAAIRDTDSRLVGVAVIFRDITEKRRFEAELLKSTKLESVGVLAGGIAHDFNNILSIVLGNVSLCKIMVEPNTEIHSRLTSAEKGCARARELTQQLLTFAKGGAPVRKSAAIQEIIQESTAFASRGSNIVCKHHADPDLWAVEVDSGQISQVFNNLVINAVQAMPKGGALGTRASNCIVTEDMALPVDPGRYVHITVEDTGCGIAPEHIGRIFDPYFTTKANGSGLGLATSYAIIQKHEGCITVESRVGEGTAFHIYLPASDIAPIPARGDTQMFVKRRGSGRILVMDDELPIRDLARASLTRLGYEVDTAEHGDEALKKFESAKTEGRPYAAIIMDLTVPGGMGGKETMKRLLDLDPHVKAIVSSGYSQDPVMANYREFGFAGVVEKPYKIESLAKTLALLTTTHVTHN